MAKPCRRSPLVAARQTARASALRRTRVKYACRSSSRKSLTEVNLFREYCGTFYGGTSAAHGTGLVQFASVRSVSCSVRKPLIWTMSHAPWRRNPFASKCSLLMSGALAHVSTLKSRRKKTSSKKQTGFWSRRRDLNPRPLGPEPSALPNCATPRLRCILYQRKRCFASDFTAHFEMRSLLFILRPESQRS